MSETNYFTVCFEGDVRSLSNPFNIGSAFGKPTTIGIGDAFEELDRYRETLENIAAGHHPNPEIAAREALNRRA